MSGNDWQNFFKSQPKRGKGSKPAGWNPEAPGAQEALHKHWEAGGHEITLDFSDDFDDDPPPDFLEIEEKGDYEKDGYYERKVTKRFYGEDENRDFGDRKKKKHRR